MKTFAKKCENVRSSFVNFFAKCRENELSEKMQKRREVSRKIIPRKP